MKKIFSFVLLTGMLTLMSFGVEEDYTNCWDEATNIASEVAAQFNLNEQDENDVFFDAFESCNQWSGMSGIDDEPFNSTVYITAY